MFIIRNIPEQKYFADINYVTVTADPLDLSDSLFNAEIIHHYHITIEEENILAYICICIYLSQSVATCMWSM